MDGLMMFFRSGDGFTDHEWHKMGWNVDRYLFIVFGNPRKAAMLTYYMDEDRRDRTEVMALDDPTAVGFRQDIAAWIRGLDRVEADITYAPSIAAAMTADIISRARCRYDLINVETPGRPFDDGRPMPEPAVESDDLPVVLRLVPSDQAMNSTAASRGSFPSHIRSRPFPPRVRTARGRSRRR